MGTFDSEMFPSYLFLSSNTSVQVNKTGKDFDLYYLPILSLQIVSGFAILLGWGRSFPEPLSIEETTCFPSAAVLTQSILGTSFMRIAMNWMEIAGSCFSKY